MDTHKRSHALAAVDEGTGRVRGKRQIEARDAGHMAAVRWAREFDDERVWAIEDCRHVSRRLEQALIAAGERVIRVSPQRMGASRKGEREPGKSDEIDSLAIARAVVKDGVESFPVAYLDERAMQVRLLSDHRKDLVEERTKMENRLRWHLLALDPELEAKVKPRSLSSLKTLERLERQLRRLPASTRLRIAREQLSHIRALTREVLTLERELRALVQSQRPWLLHETGCGPVVASVLVGRTAGAERFPSDAALARQAGACPIPCSSGQTQTRRLNRGGDRQLNWALHTIAASRARTDPRTKEYLARKRAEGKTKKAALRCLKRSLARHFYELLTRPPLTQPCTPQPGPHPNVEQTHTAPNPMVCLS
ncbi:MAG: IS110 family transposase [Solirubrobacterales bacterium]|nr:IS110 family transposase [Solirubrobacterales bacterium]